MIVKIEKDGYTIKVNGVLCPVVKQETKGVGKEVVKITKAVGPEWQAYISLSRLVEGEQEFEVAPHKVVESTRYSLTDEEAAEVRELQARIDAIIENAKARTPKKKRLEDMSIEELEAYIAARKA